MLIKNFMFFIDSSFDSINSFFRILFNSDIYYLYIILFWLIFLFSFIYFFYNQKSNIKKEWKFILFIFLLYLILGFFQFGLLKGGGESAPYLTMSVCMAKHPSISEIHPICSKDNFGDAHEIGWSALISIFFRIFSVNSITLFIFLNIFSSLTMILFYFVLRKFFKPVYSILVLITASFSPAILLFLYSTTKETAYLFFLLFSTYVFLSKKDQISILILGISLSLMAEIRIESILLFGIIFFLIKKHHLLYSIPFIITFPYKIHILSMRRMYLLESDIFSKISLKGFNMLSYVISSSTIIFVISLIVIFYYFNNRVNNKNDKKNVLFPFYILFFLILYIFSSDVAYFEYHHFIGISAFFYILLAKSLNKFKVKYLIFLFLLFINILFLLNPPSGLLEKTGNIPEAFYPILSSRESLQFSRILSNITTNNTYFLEKRDFFYTYSYLLMPDIEKTQIKNFYVRLGDEKYNFQNCNNIRLIYFNQEIQGNNLRGILDGVDLYNVSREKDINLKQMDLRNILSCNYTVYQYNENFFKIIDLKVENVKN